jgi:hypothetical protein
VTATDNRVHRWFRVWRLCAGMLVVLAGAGCGSLPGKVVRAPVAIAPVRLAGAPQTAADQALPLTVWTERRTIPAPLAIHVARIDLQCPALEVVVMPADDPDGNGPAESVLTDPLELAAQHKALVAVNANAFVVLSDANGKEARKFESGMPVDIIGLVAHAGVRRSDISSPRLCFWLDGSQHPHFGPDPGETAGMREGVNVWCNDLVAEGRPIPALGGDRHPRTAVGADAQGRWLYLVVVDGRQPGVSEGMTVRELAELLVQLGCTQGINLDGGGSSILLTAEPTGAFDIVNRPSGGSPRPVPVLLGVRPRLGSP